MRQLFDFKTGARHGPWGELMKPVVAQSVGAGSDGRIGVRGVDRGAGGKQTDHYQRCALRDQYVVSGLSRTVEGPPQGGHYVRILTSDLPRRLSGTNLLCAGITTFGRLSAVITADSGMIRFCASTQATRLYTSSDESVPGAVGGIARRT